MLITLPELTERHGITPRRILHGGANSGQERGCYRDVGAEVLWVEGNADLIPELAINLAAFPEQRHVHGMLGAHPGDTVVLNLTNPENEGQSASVLPLGTHADVHPEVSYVDTQTYVTTTVDEICSAWEFQPDFINLDLQGYELEALKGATLTLANVETVYTEINVDHLYAGCALLPELNGFLSLFGLYPAEVRLAGSPHRDGRDGRRWLGWGDCVYRRY